MSDTVQYNNRRGHEQHQHMRQRYSTCLVVHSWARQRILQGHAQAQLAIEIFAYRLARQIAGMLVPLNGLDALVFSGGIGENSSRTRKNTIDRLSHLDLSLDDERNRTHGAQSRGRISTDHGPAVMVIPTDEELLIAEETTARLEK